MQLQPAHTTDLHRNDPNGPVYYKGVYHLFYQFNPTAAIWGDMHWGHAVSTDGMLTWKELPIALSPDQPYDVGGVFSGSITLLPTINGETIPVVSYTCVDAQQTQMQCLAVPEDASDPLLHRWVKPDVNPILPKGPLGTPPTFFRDPSTAWQTHTGSSWLTAIGAVPAGVPSTVLYAAEQSGFLAGQWAYNGTLFTFPPASQWADMYECPDFFPLPSPGAAAALGQLCPAAQGWDGQVWAAKISALPGRRDYVALGCFNAGTLKWEQRGNVTLYDGGVWYASKTFDANGQRVLWGWVTETDAQEDWVTRGWAGVQSLPLLLSIHPVLAVVASQPLPALSALTSPLASRPAPQGRNSTMCASCKRQFRLQAHLNTGKATANASNILSALAMAEGSGARVCMGTWGGSGCSDGPEVLLSTLPPVSAEQGVRITSGGFIDVPAPSPAPQSCAAVCTGEYGASCVAWTHAGDSCSLFSFVGGTQACASCTSGIVGGAIVVVGPAGAESSVFSAVGTIGALAHASCLTHGTVDVDIWYDRSILQVFAAQGTVRLTSRWYAQGNASVVVSGAGASGSVQLAAVGSIWAA